MALQTIKGGLAIPPYFKISLANMVIDAANEKAAGILRAPKTGIISKVGFLTATVTTGATVDVRVETVNMSTGAPSGTLFGTNTNASQIIQDTNDNVGFTVSLTAGASVNKGDLLAIVIVNPPTSFGNMQIRINTSVTAGQAYQAAYTTVWSLGSNPMVTWLEYNDGSYASIIDVSPFITENLQSINTGTTPDEIALKFKLPFPCRVTGAWFYSYSDDYDIVLYDSDGSTILTSVSIDKDTFFTTTSLILGYVPFTGTAQLLKDTFYYLSYKPTTLANITVVTGDVPTAASMDSLPGGQNFHYAARVNAGAWTATTTRRPCIGIIIDQCDDGVGGGGGAGVWGLIR